MSILNNDNLEFFLLLLVSEVEAEKDNNDDHSKKENLQGNVKIVRKRTLIIELIELTNHANNENGTLGHFGRECPLFQPG